MPNKFDSFFSTPTAGGSSTGSDVEGTFHTLRSARLTQEAYNSGVAQQEEAARKKKEADDALKAAQDAAQRQKNSLVTKFGDFASQFNDKLFGGTARELIHLGGAVTGRSQQADKFATDIGLGEKQAVTDVGKYGATAGQVGKGIFDIAQLATGAGEAEALAKGSALVGRLAEGGRAAQTAAKIIPKVAGSVAGTGIGAVQDVAAGREKDVAKNIALGTAADIALPVAGKLVGIGKNILKAKFAKGADEALQAVKEERLALPEGRAASYGPETTRTTGGVAAAATTPEMVKINDKEYTQKFNDLAKSFDQQTKAATKLPPLKQRIVLDQIHDDHLRSLEELDHAYTHGTPNISSTGEPVIVPPVTTSTQFVTGSEAERLGQASRKNLSQTQQVEQRINQIDGIIQDATQNGRGARSADELRALMNERKAAQNVLDKKTPFDAVYGTAGSHGTPTAEKLTQEAANAFPQHIKETTYPDTQSYMGDLLQSQREARGGAFGGIRATAGDLVQEARRKLVDSAAPIEDVLHDAQRAGATIAPTENVSYQIDRVLRAPTIAGQFAKDHGMVDVIKNVDNLDEFNQYLIAKHSADLAKQGVETGRNLGADAKLVQDLSGKYEPYAAQVKDYSHKLLDYITEKGLINKDLATKLKQQYPNYVPMNRIFDEAGIMEGKGTGKGVASVGSQSIIQRIKGSTRQVENPLESLLSKTNDAFQQGERNDAARMLANYKDLPNNPFQLRELGKDEVIGNRPTVSFLDQGVKRTFETTKDIAEAAKSLSREQLGLLGKIVSVPTRLLRLGATGLNLPFVASNIVKDQATLFINSNRAAKTSIVNPANFLRAMFHAIGNGKEYENLLRAGAGGTSFDIGRDAVTQTVGRIRASRNVGSRIAYTVRHPGDLIRAAEDAIGKSENLGRIQSFTGTRDALLKEGHTLQDATILAADAARNNTANFARSGDWGRVLNVALPYLNAGVQGSRVFMRALKERPIATGTKLAATAFMPMAAMTAWNLSDPKRKEAYDNIQDFEKDNNFIIIPPNPTKDDQGRWNVIKIPMSQEIAGLTRIVRNGVEAASADKNFDVNKMLTNLLGSATSLNVQSPRELVNQLTPQAIKPGVEALTNQNLYTGNQIVPDSMKNYPAPLQYRDRTSGTAMKLGQALNISPLQIENAVNTSFGGVGRQVLNASDQALSAAGQVEPGHVGGQSAIGTTGAKFTKASGQSEASVAYEQDQAAKTQAQQKVTPQTKDYYSTLGTVRSNRTRVSNQVTSLIKNNELAKARRIAEDFNNSLDEKFVNKIKDKHPGYDPRTDDNYHSLIISTRGFGRRRKNARASQQSEEQLQEMLQP